VRQGSTLDLEAENKRLKQALASTEMERDILKKPRRTSRKTSCEVRIHESPPVLISNCGDE
jgi:hypothetical protein